MNDSKVILVQPPIEDFYLTKKRTLPYGLACIAACLKEKGFHVEILDALATHKSKTIAYPEAFSFLLPFYGRKDLSAFSLFHEFKHFGYSYEHIGAAIREKQPFVVGISSLFTPYCDTAIKTALAIKKFYPCCKIVLGGHHPTLFPDHLLASEAVDYVLRGEGETSMAELCQALKKGSEIDHIPGIAFKKNKAIFVSRPSWVSDFTAFPLPAMDLISHDFYKRNNKGSTLVVASRGCPMRCSYCSVSTVSFHAPFRQRSVKDIIKEIQVQTENQDIGFIDFEDENLCLNKPWFIQLFSKIQELFTGKNIEFRAMNGLYPPAIDEEIVSLMKTVGFKTLNLSLGSTSKTQLKKFNRRDVRDAFEKALCLAKRHDLDCVSYIIAAAPGQTAQSSLEDLLYLAEKRTLAGLSIFYPAPGSLDYQLCKTNKILPQNFCLMRSTALPIEDTTSRLQSATLLRLSRILNFMKHLMDTCDGLPDPEAFFDRPFPSCSDRTHLSKKLLQWFLYDGKIRGVHATGEIYTHMADTDLTRQFIKRIKRLLVMGVK